MCTCIKYRALPNFRTVENLFFFMNKILVAQVPYSRKFLYGAKFSYIYKLYTK